MHLLGSRTGTGCMSRMPASSFLCSCNMLAVLQGLRRSSFAELKYKGDWMRRPLSSSEIGWLVRILLHISDAANTYLQLDQPPPAADRPLPRSPKVSGSVLPVGQTLLGHVRNARDLDFNL